MNRDYLRQEPLFIAVLTAFLLCADGVAAAGESETPSAVDVSSPSIAPPRSVIDFGADPTGSMSATIAVKRAVQTDRRIIFPCGVYLIDEPIELRSGSDVSGSGSCTVLKISSTLAVVSRRDLGDMRHVFTNRTYDNDGNSDIQIHDLKIDAVDSPPTGVVLHAIGFYNVTRVRIYNIVIDAAGPGGAKMDDGVAFTNSSHYVVQDNVIRGARNACIDQWGGSSSFSISDNVCDGLGLGSYGILVSGFTTANAPATTRKGILIRNKIANVTGAGIWLQGGWNRKSGMGAAYGLVRDVAVSENTIDTVTIYHGIYLSDARYNNISRNRVLNTGVSGILVGTEYQGSSVGNTIDRNLIMYCNATSQGNPCIWLRPGAISNTLVENNVSGTSQSYSITIDRGANDNVLRGGMSTIGVFGAISDSGNGTLRE